MKVYIGAIVPHQASGQFYFRVSYPSNSQNRLDRRSGVISLFGVFKRPNLEVPISIKHFHYTTTLISNDHTRNVKVEPISKSIRHSDSCQRNFQT